MPTRVKRTVAASVAVLIAGAIGIILLRGPAMLIDLGTAAAKFLCL